MWRPLEEKDLGAIDSTRIPDGKNECSDALGSSVNRQCWVWIHASAFVDGINAIRCACQKEVMLFWFSHFMPRPCGSRTWI